VKGVKSDKRYSFEIQWDQFTTYLAARSQADMDQWMLKVSTAIYHANGESLVNDL